MQPVLLASQWVVRVAGVLLLLSGLLVWAGDAPRSLVPWHMLLGIILVVALLLLAYLASQAGAPVGLAAGAAVLALVVLALGWTQATLVPGGTHWIVQGLHLLLGMLAVGLGEMLGARVRRARLATAG